MDARIKLLALAALALSLGVGWTALASRDAQRATREAEPEAAVPGAQRSLALPAEAPEVGERAALEPASTAPVEEGPASAEGLPLTTLELQVVRAGGVARDLRAWLVAGYLRELPADLSAPPPGCTPLFAGAGEDGVARFADLAPGPYRCALAFGDQRLEQSVRLIAGQRVTRLVLRLGSATIEGRVFDDQGLALEGARVQLSRPGYGRNPPPFECFASTDVHGAYSFREVGSGLQAVTAHLDGSLASDGIRRESLVPFQGIVRVDFGSSAQEGVVWRGVVRNALGEPVVGPGEIRVRDAGQQEVRTFAFAADGSFTLRLRPGEHHVWLQPAGYFPEQLDLGLQRVPAGDLERDLALSGARLRVRLVPPPEWTGTLDPSLRAFDGSGSSLRLVPLGDGSFVRDGLAPGEYALCVAGLDIARSGSEYRTTLDGAGRELELELVERR